MGCCEVENWGALKSNALNWRVMMRNEQSAPILPFKTVAGFAKPLRFTPRGKQPGDIAGSGNALRLCVEKLCHVKVPARTCSVSNKKNISVVDDREGGAKPQQGALIEFLQLLLLEKWEKGVKMMPGMTQANDN